MKKYDYHTHNGYSGCASKQPYSIENGWKTMQQRGVTKYGISNHFPTRPVYGDYLPELRKEVDSLSNDNILLGMELELDNEDGSTKLTKKLEDIVDYIVGSAHHQPCNFLTLPDIEEDEIEEYFEWYQSLLVNSFKKNPINIWGHPLLEELKTVGDKFWKKYMLPLYQECIEVCASQNIAIEITPSYNRKCKQFPRVMNVLEEMYSIAMENKDIYFVTSSDAHSLDILGDLTIPMQYVKKFKIPDDRILELTRN